MEVSCLLFTMMNKHKYKHKYNSIEYHIQHELTNSDKKYAATYLNKIDETKEITIAEMLD